MIDACAWLCSAGAFILAIYAIRTYGLIEGGRNVWIGVILLLPSWFNPPFGVTRIDPRSTCALAFIICFLLQPYRRQERQFFFSDLAICLLMASLMVSQFLNAEFAPMPLIEQVRAFGFPYIVGRLFLRSVRDIETALPSICIAISILSLLTIFEGVFAINPIDKLLGKTWIIDEWTETQMRWGLKRANGPQSHPIYLGLTIGLMMPWLIEAARSSWRGEGKYWWRFVPFLAVVAVVCTGSRASQITVFLVFAFDFFHIHERWRGLLIILALSAGGIFFVNREEIISFLSEYAGEKSSTDSFVIINGQVYDYTGTKHRDLLTIVYEEQYEQSGYFGYGMDKQRMPKDPNMDTRFESIDNHFLLFHLQYGLMGVIFFIMVASSFILNLLPVIWSGQGATGRLAAGILGAITGSLISMRGVWFSSDYGLIWLFSGGVSVCLAQLHRSPERATTTW